ncbi:MAG: type II toxin-antitoxin system ParD family antitoxin [Candidatus Tectomicrobia bacterium]|nr:type II toxin-antitoxin system ParD family antitoxin [Candidatus Tectomicrobia bacterium]
MIKGLSADLETFVQQELASGKYRSEEEIVCAGLRLLQEREQELDRIAEQLRPAIQDYLDGDRGVELDPDAIKAQGRKRLTQVDSQR